MIYDVSDDTFLAFVNNQRAKLGRAPLDEIKVDYGLTTKYLTKYTTVEKLREEALNEKECDRSANIDLRADWLQAVEKLLSGKKINKYDRMDIDSYIEDIEYDIVPETNKERYKEVLEKLSKYKK